MDIGGPSSPTASRQGPTDSSPRPGLPRGSQPPTDKPPPPPDSPGLTTGEGSSVPTGDAVPVVSQNTKKPAAVPVHPATSPPDPTVQGGAACGGVLRVRRLRPRLCGHYPPPARPCLGLDGVESGNQPRGDPSQCRPSPPSPAGQRQEIPPRPVQNWLR